jgi:dCMP deaminase
MEKPVMNCGIVVNDQKTIDRTYINIVTELAKLSHCVSYKVAALYLSENGRILMTGINGTSKGHENCDHHFVNFTELNYDENGKLLPEYRKIHSAWSDKYERHAEVSGVVDAAREGISLAGSTLYCTLQPCWPCLKTLSDLGLKRIVFKEYYDRTQNGSSDDEAVKFMKKSGVIMEKFDD